MELRPCISGVVGERRGSFPVAGASCLSAHFISFLLLPRIPLLMIKRARPSCFHGVLWGNRPAGIQSTFREPFGTGVAVEPGHFDGFGITGDIPQNCEFSALFSSAIVDADGRYPNVLSRPGLLQVPSVLTLECLVALLAEVIEDNLFPSLQSSQKNPRRCCSPANSRSSRCSTPKTHTWTLTALAIHQAPRTNSRVPLLR